MAIPVSYCTAPQVLDAVGAVKVTEYYGTSVLDNVYTYLRCYVENGSLVFSITAFEQHPPKESRTGAAFSFDESGRSVFVSCNGAGELSAALYAQTPGGDTKLKELCLPAPLTSRSVDEQGYGWSFVCTLPAGLIEEEFGAKLVPGSTFWGNVYKYHTEEDAFGAAFPCPPGTHLPAAESFGSFVVVPY